MYLSMFYTMIHITSIQGQKYAAVNSKTKRWLIYYDAEWGKKEKIITFEKLLQGEYLFEFFCLMNDLNDESIN